MLQDLRYLMPDRDRHGNPRLRVRVMVNGKARTRTIHERQGTPEFAEAYAKAVKELRAGERAAPTARDARPGAKPGTWGWMALDYFDGEEFRALDGKSQITRRGIIEACMREPLKPGLKVLMRDVPIADITVAHIKVLRDRKVKAGRPAAANNRRKYLSSMFSWALDQTEKQYPLAFNPCRDTRRAKYVSSGYYTWTLANVAKYMDTHKPGSMAYLALCLLLFLGARRGDAVRLGPKNMTTVKIIDQTGHAIEQPMMVYVPRKTTYVRTDESHKPILLPLAEAIRLTATGLKTFLVTSRGKPFTDAGFGNKMREWCDQAGLPDCTAHGLKKVSCVIAADLGATDRQMMALYDWVTEKQANTYTARANRKKLAAECAALLGKFWTATPPTLIENEQRNQGGAVS